MGFLVGATFNVIAITFVIGPVKKNQFNALFAQGVSVKFNE